MFPAEGPAFYPRPDMIVPKPPIVQTKTVQENHSITLNKVLLQCCFTLEVTPPPQKLSKLIMISMFFKIFDDFLTIFNNFLKLFVVFLTKYFAVKVEYRE